MLHTLEGPHMRQLKGAESCNSICKAEMKKLEAWPDSGMSGLWSKALATEPYMQTRVTSVPCLGLEIFTTRFRCGR